jgi:aryl-alcohol dehydrogenase-like predicted oxidoreductase
VALAWLLAQPGVTAPVIGPRTPEHLQDLLPAAGLRLSDEQVERLGRHTRPPETYPQRMLAEQVGIDVAQQPLGRR